MTSPFVLIALGVAMAAQPAFVDLHVAVPDNVQFFAATLTSADQPPDSTLAFGASRQGLFLTPDEAYYYVFETPPSDGRKVPGTVVTWRVARSDITRIDPLADDCIALVSDTVHKTCLGAIRHHRLQVLEALTDWLASAPAKDDKGTGH